MDDQLPNIWKNISTKGELFKGIRATEEGKEEDKAKDASISEGFDIVKASIKELIEEGNKRVERGEFEIGLKCFLKALEKDEQNIDIHYKLSLLYTKLNELDSALAHLNELKGDYEYRKARQLDVLLGYIYIKQEDYKTAFEVLKGVEKGGEEGPNTLSLLGYIYYKKGNYKKAKEYYNKVLEVDVGNANAYNSLGMMELEGGKTEAEWTEGLKLCKKALSLSPNNAAYLDSVGYGHYKIQEEEEAIKHLKEAYEQAPEDKSIREHLQMLLNPDK